jgi:nicotinamidase-related amidase
MEKGAEVEDSQRAALPTTLEEILNPGWCAVLCIDMQNDLVHPQGKIAGYGLDMSGMYEIIPRCQAFLQEARTLDLFVVHVQTVCLPRGASLSESWRRALGTILSGEPEFVLEGTWGAAIIDECAPLPGEPIVTKRRSSAFRATSLDLILRANGIRTVVCIGEQTPGCVEATFRDASYHDYYNVLVEDCVAAYDKEQHEASLLIQRRRHDVCTAAEVLGIWRRAGGRDSAVLSARSRSAVSA